LGSQTQSTPVLSNVSHGFTGRSQESFIYQATSSSETLSFLAVGTPTGVPPFSLLAGVQVAALPEPEEWVMMLVGIPLIGWQIRQKQAKRRLS